MRRHAHRPMRPPARPGGDTAGAAAGRDPAEAPLRPEVSPERPVDLRRPPIARDQGWATRRPIRDRPRSAHEAAIGAGVSRDALSAVLRAITESPHRRAPVRGVARLGAG